MTVKAFSAMQPKALDSVDYPAINLVNHPLFLRDGKAWVTDSNNVKHFLQKKYLTPVKPGRWTYIEQPTVGKDPVKFKRFEVVLCIRGECITYPVSAKTEKHAKAKAVSRRARELKVHESWVYTYLRQPNSSLQIKETS